MLDAAERQLTRLSTHFLREDEQGRTRVAQWWAQKQVEQPMADLRREADEPMRRILARLGPLVQAEAAEQHAAEECAQMEFLKGRDDAIRRMNAERRPNDPPRLPSPPGTTALRRWRGSPRPRNCRRATRVQDEEGGRAASVLLRP